MLIDLSVSVNEQTPVYPGDPTTKIVVAGILPEHGYQDHVVTFGTHVGTHIDAPSHMIAGGKNLHQFPLETFTGTAVCIQTTTFNLEEIQHAPLEKGDIVFFYTGMSEQYHEPSYFENYPVLTEEVATYLIAKGIKIVGVDTCSVDRPPFGVHKLLLGGEILIIENLTNLSSLVGKRFEVSAFPLKLEIDGAPVRVVARLSSVGFSS